MLNSNRLNVAEQLARQAQDMRVPDTAYQAGDPRPWMLLMEIDRKLRQTASGDAHPAVAPGELFGVPPMPSTRVARALYDPLDDTTRNMLASAEELLPPDASVGQADEWQAGNTMTPSAGSMSNGQPFPAPPMQPPRPTVRGALAPPQQMPFPAAIPATGPGPAAFPTPGAPPDDIGQVEVEAVIDSEGMRLFADGRRALKDHDLDRARQLFREAWTYEAELDPETRQALQDNLHGLRERESEFAAAGDEPELLQPTPAETKATKELMAEISRRQTTARALRQTNPQKAWDELKRLRTRVAQADVPEENRQNLLARLDHSISEMEDYFRAEPGTDRTRPAQSPTTGRNRPPSRATQS